MSPRYTRKNGTGEEGGGGGSEVNGVFRESKPGRSVGGVHRTRGIYARIKEATLAAS